MYAKKYFANKMFGKRIIKKKKKKKDFFILNSVSEKQKGPGTSYQSLSSKTCLEKSLS